MPDGYVIVLTTMPAEGDDAAQLAEALVGERLAACVNILPPMTSVYRWEDKVDHDAERQIVVKTRSSRVPALWERLRDLHPYDVPEFVVLPVIDGSDAYLKWIRESTAVSPEPA